jgi:hypothetical protein
MISILPERWSSLRTSQAYLKRAIAKAILLARKNKGKSSREDRERRRAADYWFLKQVSKHSGYGGEGESGGGLSRIEK